MCHTKTFFSSQFVAIFFMVIPFSTSAGVISFTHDDIAFVMDTTDAFCDFNNEQQALFERSQRKLTAAGQTPSIFGQAACKTNFQFPNSSMNLRWHGKLAPKLDLFVIKKALEQNFKQQKKGSVTLDELMLNLGPDLPLVKILETTSNQAMLYMLFSQKVSDANELIKLETLVSYIYIPDTGDIFILAITNTKSKTLEELLLLHNLSTSIANSLKLNV